MSKVNGSRRRAGCSSCRRRKRRCDEQKPSCLNCQKSGKECIYPTPGSASNPLRFVVATSTDHYIIPFDQGAEKPQFLYLSSLEIAKLSPGLGDAETKEGESEEVRLDDVHLKLPIPSTMSEWNFNDGRESLWNIEMSLMQYYVEVVCSSRVYVQTDRNSFRTFVMPRVLGHQGPLLFTVLAISAAEWRQKSIGDGRDYGALSAPYKVQALHELQSCLADIQNSEENLLTCVLLSSLEIAEGSKPTWLRHLQGALALLDNFTTSIDPTVAKFVLQYFRFRYILMETTRPKNRPRPLSSDPDDLSYHKAMNRVAEAEYAFPLIHSSESLVDEHIGCSMELIAIINRISALSLTVDSLDEPKNAS
ncbi:hypothetical protein AK830_g4199 [Neonectria ditissima]|uniref:Zn(2)-C6 fungal-type domain-containing protein n=1 Tax=Neonectria ditissima TaxID=78410 RepID=A0A0P7B6X6_9HYPO|nr:hypothetical protein AK830_g4199 [Neonectria ditissima]